MDTVPSLALRSIPARSPNVGARKNPSSLCLEALHQRGEPQAFDANPVQYGYDFKDQHR